MVLLLFEKKLEVFHEEDALESDCRDNEIKLRNISCQSFYNKKEKERNDTELFNNNCTTHPIFKRNQHSKLKSLLFSEEKKIFFSA